MKKFSLRTDVEAIQFSENLDKSLRENLKIKRCACGVTGKMTLSEEAEGAYKRSGYPYGFVYILETVGRKIQPGDWIIMKPSGDVFVMDNETFSGTYQPV